MNTATTHEQSARLLACGVDPDTADMCYLDGYGEESLHAFPSPESPAWSLGALLTEVLPKKIKDDFGCTKYTFRMGYNHCIPDFPWTITYEGNGLLRDIYVPNKSPIEACVRMVEKLKEEGLI